jgi:hypothetical protein
VKGGACLLPPVPWEPEEHLGRGHVATAEDEATTAFRWWFERYEKYVWISINYIEESWKINTFQTLTVVF